MEFLGPQIFDLLIAIFGRLVGRPAQRARARRLARTDRITSVIFSPSSPRVMQGPFARGAARVQKGRIKLWDTDLRVLNVEMPGEAGPGERLDDGDLLFRPPSTIFTLHTPEGTVKWAVLDWQTDVALDLLGYPSSGNAAINTDHV